MRILGLIISLAIIAFLAYFMAERVIAPTENTTIKDGDTIFDTVEYAEEVKTSAELSACLRLCEIELERQVICKSECAEKYK